METLDADRDLTGADWTHSRPPLLILETLALAAEFVNTGDQRPIPSPPAPGTLAPPITSGKEGSPWKPGRRDRCL